VERQPHTGVLGRRHGRAQEGDQPIPHLLAAVGADVRVGWQVSDGVEVEAAQVRAATPDAVEREVALGGAQRGEVVGEHLEPGATSRRDGALDCLEVGLTLRQTHQHRARQRQRHCGGAQVEGGRAVAHARQLLDRPGWRLWADCAGLGRRYVRTTVARLVDVARRQADLFDAGLAVEPQRRLGQVGELFRDAGARLAHRVLLRRPGRVADRCRGEESRALAPGVGREDNRYRPFVD
jgi:hypothetical protein